MAGGANPQAVAAPQPTNPFMRASSANQMALNTYADPSARAMQMMNPYQQQVIDATLRDVGTAAQMGLNQIGAQAQSAGAYGGSRQGIAEAEALKGFNQQALDQTARLRQQGFNTSMANAFNAASGLQNVGQQAFNMGQALNQNQMAQGALQQAAMQRLLDAGKSQFRGQTGAPNQALGTFTAGITGMPQLQGEQSYMNPGLLNYAEVLGML